jgi:hypothetical protein
MQQQRRADVLWIGDDEVKDFERIRDEAKSHKRDVPEQIKQILKGG